MNKFLHLLFFFFLMAGASAQNVSLSWANRLGSTGDEIVQSMTVDPSGNVYVVGSFEGTVDFDPSATVVNRTSLGSADAFLAKYSNTGALVFVDQFGSSAGDEAIYSVYANATNVYIGGYFSGTVDFDPGSGVVNLTSGGALDLFFGKFTSNGALNWVNKTGSTDNDLVYAITADPSGNVYVAGAFTLTADFDFSSATLDRTSAGDFDIFLVKVNSAGALQWANTMGSPEDDRGRGVAVSGSNVYLAATYAGDGMDIDPGSANASPGNLGLEDGLFAEYGTATGALGSWGTLRSTEKDLITSIWSDGTVLYTGGAFSDSATLFGSTGNQTRVSNGGTDAFVAVHVLSDFSIYSMGAGGGTGDDGVDMVAVDGSSNLYSAGYFNETVDFDPGVGVTNLVSAGDYDGFISKYNADGSFAWVIGQSSTGIDETSAVAVDASGNIYGAGIFSNSMDVNPGATTTTLTSLGSYDGFVAKFSEPLLAAEPTSSPTDLIFTDQKLDEFTYSWTAASGNPDGYIVLRSVGSPVNGIPQDGVEYQANETIGNANVRVPGTDSTGPFTSSSLEPSTTYYIAIFSYNGDGALRNYRQAFPLTGFTSTLDVLAPEPTAPPTNFVFFDRTTTGFSYEFTDALGDHDGYLHLRKEGSPPTFVPVDGVEYNEDEVMSDGSVVQYNDNVATGNISTGLTPGTTYHYKIYVYNGSGATTNYLNNPLTASVTTLVPDTTPPSVTDNTSVSVNEGVTAKVSVNVTDAGSGVQYVVLYFKKITGTNSDILDVNMENTSGTTWEFNIPTSAIDAQGVDYQVYAYDNNDNEFIAGLKQIRVKYNDMTVPNLTAGSDQASYRIISVPLVLEKKTVKDVLEDDLGTLDPKTWRLFRYQSGKNTALTSTSPIDIGNGYWLINKQSGKTIDIGAGITADAGMGKEFEIPVSAGWNQIGNPFTVNISWADVVAINPGLGTLRTYTGTWSNGTSLERFSGGFVNIPSSAGITKIKVPISRDTRNTAPVDFNNALDSEFWAVDLKVDIGSASYELGGVGMHPDASNDYDVFDGFTLPRFFDYVELSHTKELEGTHYSRDIVKSVRNFEWTFLVESNLEVQEGSLSWDNSYFGENDKQLFLWDESQQRAIDMRQTNRYVFDRSESNSFRVIYGDRDFVKEKTKPNRLVFHSVFPIPASERVTFSYSIPASVESLKGTIEIYNLIGQKIATLTDCPGNEGYHEVAWNIDGDLNPAGGVYVSVLKLGKAIAQQRLVINK